MFAWGLVMIAALQFRHSENGVLDLQRDSNAQQPTPPSNSPLHLHRDEDSNDGVGSRGVGGSSRYLLQRFSIVDSTPSYVARGKGGGKANDYESYSGGGGENSGAGAHRSSVNELLIDKREPRTEEELVREIESRLPSLPLAYWLKTSLQLENGGKRSANLRQNGKQVDSLNGQKDKPSEIEKDKETKKKIPSKGKGCVPRFPSIFDLEFNNIYWQTLRSSNGTFQLFGAYYDDRKLSRIGPAVRIVGMIDRIEPRVKTYCQMWFDGDPEPAIVENLEYKYVWYSKWGNYKQGIYQPYVIACKVPKSHWKRGAPASISIVEKACDTSTNNLRVIYNKPDVKKGFAVCVKGLDFLHEDLSVRLVEWIELIGLLGADKIYFYQLQVHPNVSKVLDHYTRLGKVEVTPLTLPGGQPNVPAFQHMYLTKKTNNKRQNELIPYNDCLYKHMYEYEYIALLDVDEVIMPLRDNTWPELMKRVLPKALAIRNETRASYNVRNVYFLDDLLHSHGSFEHLPR